MDVKELRESLGIDDYLELVKEDKNCNGAYISFGQYMYLLENEIQELKKQIEELRIQVSAREEVANKYKEAIDKVLNIINECKLLMPHEFDWGEQIAYIEELLKEVE